MRSKKSGENKTTKAQGALEEAQDELVDFYDAGHEKRKSTREPNENWTFGQSL